MRKLALFGLACTLLVFTACQDSDDVKIADEAGNISGMGNAGGELQSTNFDLPQGISLVGDIVGTIEEEGTASSLKSVNRHSHYGSGGRYIKVKLVLKNETSRYRTAWLPPGLLFEVHNKGYQHAILLCWTWICFLPNETREFELHLYCLNKGLPGSLLNTKFKMLGVTSSERMRRIIRWCGLKKINIEHFEVANKAGLKSAASYEELVEQIQEIVWAETNESGLTAEQEEFLGNLPDLEDGAVPPEISDSDFLQDPPYWEEYSAE